MICPLLSRTQFIALPEGAGPETMLVNCREHDCAWFVVSYPDGTTQTEQIGRCAMHWLGDHERARFEAHGDKIDEYEGSH